MVGSAEHDEHVRRHRRIEVALRVVDEQVGRNVHVRPAAEVVAQRVAGVRHGGKLKVAFRHRGSVGAGVFNRGGDEYRACHGGTSVQRQHTMRQRPRGTRRASGAWGAACRSCQSYPLQRALVCPRFSNREGSSSRLGSCQPSCVIDVIDEAERGVTCRRDPRHPGTPAPQGNAPQPNPNPPQPTNPVDIDAAASYARRLDLAVRAYGHVAFHQQLKMLPRLGLDALDSFFDRGETAERRTSFASLRVE